MLRVEGGCPVQALCSEYQGCHQIRWWGWRVFQKEFREQEILNENQEDVLYFTKQMRKDPGRSRRPETARCLEPSWYRRYWKYIVKSKTSSDWERKDLLSHSSGWNTRQRWRLWHRTHHFSQMHTTITECCNDLSSEWFLFSYLPNSFGSKVRDHQKRVWLEEPNNWHTEVVLSPTQICSFR